MLNMHCTYACVVHREDPAFLSLNYGVTCLLGNNPPPDSDDDESDESDESEEEDDG